MLLRGVYQSNAQLILNPTSYREGGTDVGLVGDMHNLGVGMDVSLFSKVRTSTQYSDGAIHSIKFIYRVIMLDDSEHVMSLLFGEGNADKWEGFVNYKPGHPITAHPGMLKHLLIRPHNAKKKHLRIPNAFVFGVGPLLWDRERPHLDSAALLIAAMQPDDDQPPVHYGDHTSLAAIPTGGA